MPNRWPAAAGSSLRAASPPRVVPARARVAPRTSRARGCRSLDQNQKDLLGLALVAGSVFFSFVFYLGWDGGKVGEAFADGFVWLFGGVGYLVPVALFAAGAILVLGPMLLSVWPFKAGGLFVLIALMLGLAAALSASAPMTRRATPRSRRRPGSSTTAARSARWSSGSRERSSRRSGRTSCSSSCSSRLHVAHGRLHRRRHPSDLGERSHHDAAGQALHGGVRARQAAAGARRAPEPADTEPVVRATHVEVPSIEIEEEWDDEVPEVVEGQAIDTEDGEEDDEFIVKAAEPPKAEDLTRRATCART